MQNLWLRGQATAVAYLNSGALCNLWPSGYEGHPCVQSNHVISRG